VFKLFKQSGAIPYRVKNGKTEILLITSSSRKRWIIPKGWVEPYLSSADSAVKEAKEEAGVLGSITSPVIGTYQHRKWGIAFPVEVFLMQVETVLEDWAEAEKRERKWLSISEATECVKEAELKRIFKSMEQLTS
jgi:8-oxo-dGTP pyrophosphatase MutT (NUDIX family)